VVLTLTARHPRDELGPVPANARLVEFVSHSEILKRCCLLVSHAGHGVVTKALFYGVPMDYTLQALDEIRYDVWGDYDPKDTLRFYALRLHETGLIKSDPQKLIAENTDWRFLNELKRELKV
jgi:hypothetical protein